jgi:hypothetical protein
MRSRTSPLILGTIVVLAVGGVVAFLVWGALIKTTIDEELFRLSYQFLLIVVIGGALSLLYQQFSAERALDERRIALLRQIHSELLTAFNVAKRARRALRAHVGSAITQDSRLIAEQYDEQMDRITDAQLTFELYAKRAEDGLWFERGNALAGQLRSIEKYLGEIGKEYEKKRNSFAGMPSSKLLSELPVLAEFIGPYKDADNFKKRFKVPFREALSELVKAGLATI